MRGWFKPWRLLHAAVAAFWTLLLWDTLWAVAIHGDLPRSASQSGHYDTSFVLFVVTLCAATVASALRGLWNDS